MMNLVRRARCRQARGGITPRMAITGHRERTTRGSIVTLDQRGQPRAGVPGKGIDLAPVALDSPDQA
jgi:hypothetical protein